MLLINMKILIISAQRPPSVEVTTWPDPVLEAWHLAGHGQAH